MWCTVTEIEGVAPEFTAKLKDVEAPAGGEARFDCKVTSQPEPEVSWYVIIQHNMVFTRVDAVFAIYSETCSVRPPYGTKYCGSKCHVVSHQRY